MVESTTILGCISELGANTILLDVAYLGYLIFQTMVTKMLSYGSLLSLYESASSLKNGLKNLTKIIPKFQQHSFYIEKIRSFLAFESEIKDGPNSINSVEFESLSLNHITFRYSEDEPTLKDVSLTIKAGEKIAIVGYNGAGKTTLIKLFMRLYDVQEGSVLVNGKDIREYIVKDYRKLYGSVFQDYKLYGASLGENVKTDLVKEEDEQAIINALDKSGFAKRFQNLSNCLNTAITREFDEEGVNLSGGEAQKVAIARSFLKDCPVIILDEPSSALDPVSEYNLNESMLKAAENKTVIFISHRLSSTKMADRIYMLENGRVIEQGSHKELMENGGRYAAMFNMQAEKYQM
jgi:ABC-type multidrug transport system, ATPase and permease components